MALFSSADGGIKGSTTVSYKGAPDSARILLGGVAVEGKRGKLEELIPSKTIPESGAGTGTGELRMRVVGELLKRGATGET